MVFELEYLPTLNLLNLCSSHKMVKSKSVPFSSKPAGNMVWPKEVWFLEPECGHVIDGPPGCDVKNQPRTIHGWIQAELRQPECMVNPIGRLDLMIRIVHYRFDRIFLGTVAKFPKTYDAYDAYNAAWASIGYLENQSQKVITLLRKCPQFNPEGYDG